MSGGVASQDSDIEYCSLCIYFARLDLSDGCVDGSVLLCLEVIHKWDVIGECCNLKGLRFAGVCVCANERKI